MLTESAYSGNFLRNSAEAVFVVLLIPNFPISLESILNLSLIRASPIFQIFWETIRMNFKQSSPNSLKA